MNATTLRDLGGPTTVPHELTQNADDAGDATVVKFTLSDNEIFIWNDGTFTDCGEDGKICPWPKRCDLHAFRLFAGRTKAADAKTTGAFGVGFTSVYHVTDAPELLYGDEHWILDELALEDDRLQSCDERCGRTHGVSGTTFILPWARTGSRLRRALAVPPVTERTIEELEEALIGDAPAMLLFLQRIGAVEVVTRDRQLKLSRDSNEKSTVISDGTVSTKWITLTADFMELAQPLIAKADGLIKPDRPIKVTVAVPAVGDPSPGRLYATLPTQTPSGLPGHVNASFFPSTDRKSVRFESEYDSEWNRAAMAAAATGLADSAEYLAETLGISGFWKFVGAITDLEKTATSGQPNHSSAYLAALRSVVPGLPVVDTTSGQLERPDAVLLPSAPELYDSANALTKAGLAVVAHHLHGRLHTNSVYSAYRIKILTAGHLAEALKSAGHTEVFDPGDGPFTLDEIGQLLEAFELLPGNVAKVDGIRDVAIVPCRNGKIAPPSQALWPASDEDADLFELLVDDILIADTAKVESSCSGLRELCPPLDVSRAALILKDADADRLRVLWDNLLDWLSRNFQSIDETSRDLLRDLAIYPDSTGRCAPLTALSLPNDFRDPINLATLVEETAARNYHKLLTMLGARPLNVVEYFQVHIIPATEQQRLSAEQGVQLLRLVASQQVQLESLRDRLATVPLVPCLDGRLCQAREAHFPSPDLAILAPDLPVAVTETVPEAVLDWLGVPRVPTTVAIHIAVSRLAQQVNPDSSAAEAVLRTLAGRANSTTGAMESPPEFLTSQRWLPVKNGGGAKPNEVLPSNANHLYGEQGKELGLAGPVQTRYFSQLISLGMPNTPPVTTIVAHLRHCAETGADMSPDVYRMLSYSPDHPAVRTLKGTRCIRVASRVFALPSLVFWQPTPFGRWSTTLPEPWLAFKPFFDVVGVKNEPGPVEIADILRAISNEFETDPVDPDGEMAIRSCWTQLSEMLEEPEAERVLADLGHLRTMLDARNVLERPDSLFFEDSRALHKRFPLLANNVIPRAHGTWPALAEAGVQRVEEIIKAKLLSVETEADQGLAERIGDRMSALRRVLGDGAAPEELRELNFRRASVLSVLYRAELFGYLNEVGPEPVDAIFLPEDRTLAHSENASDRAIARELARAIAPDDDPGALAMRIEPVLSARSAAEAHDALDDFGIAKLDTTEHETAWSLTAEAGADLGDNDPLAEPMAESGAADAPHEDNPPTADDDGNEAADPTSGTEHAKCRLIGASGSSGRPQSGSRSNSAATGRHQPGSAGPRTGRQTRLRSYVVETDEDEAERGTVGDEAPDLSPVDIAGVARVLDYERACGRKPDEQAHTNAGFDIESFDNRGQISRRIEVKSTGGKWSIAGVMLSRRQHEQAVTDGGLFWLYVVENAQDDDFRIYRIQDPAAKIDYFGFDGGWKSVAEADLERDEAGSPSARRAPFLGRGWDLPADLSKVAFVALLAPGRQPRQVVVPERIPGLPYPGTHSSQQRLFNLLADRLAFRIEVQHFDEIGTLTGEFFIADRVNVQLIPCDLFVLSTCR